MPARIWNGHKVPDDADLETLGRMLDADPPAPWPAFVALSARRDPAALALITARCTLDDPMKRRAAIEAIGSSPIGAQAVDQVRRALDDPAPAVVDAAITAIGRLRDHASHARILTFLRDRNPYYRSHALAALGGIWMDEDFDTVFQIAEHDRDERTRKNASMLLHDHPRDWRRLVALWVESSLPRERAWACELIGERGDTTDEPLLEPMRRDTDGHVRQRAEEALLALEGRGAT